MKRYSFYSLGSLMVMVLVLFAHILSSTSASAQTSVSLSVAVKQTACATSVQEPSTSISKSSDLRIFPNPASSQFVVERENTLQGSSILLSLVNARGEIVWTAQEQATNGGKWRKTVSTEHIATGAYILTIETNGQRESRSVVIK